MDIKYMLDTNNWFNYSDFYDSICDKNDFKVFVELGVWKGHSISYLAKKLSNKEDVKIYAVDIFEDWDRNKEVLNEVKYINEIYNANLIKNGVRDIITDIKSISWEAASMFEDESIDFIFIDADHRYESVKKDISSWFPKLKNNGIISGHDYRNDDNGMGVVQAVNEFFSEFQLYDGSVWYHRK